MDYRLNNWNNLSFNHIINQESPTDNFIVFLTFCCCCLSAVLAVFGNLAIIWIIVSVKSMRNPTNYFIANVCVSDIFIGALVVPFQFQVTLLRRWVLPWFMCYMCPTIQVITVSNSIFTLTAIALERYRAVIYPLKAHISKLNAKVVILMIWIFSILLSLPTILAFRVELLWDFVKEEKTMPYCHNVGLSETLFGKYNSALVCIQYFIPLCIISFAYLRMALTLRTKKDDCDVSIARINGSQIRQKKKKAIKMLFIVVALFQLCWLPLQIFNISKEIWPQINGFKYIDVIRFSCNWLALSNSCFNPYIYVIHNEKFNKQFRQKFRIIYCVCCSTPQTLRSNSVINNINDTHNKIKDQNKFF